MGSDAVGNQASWNRSNARAGARGGARPDQPQMRQCSRSIERSFERQLMRVGAEGGVCQRDPLRCHWH